MSLYQLEHVKQRYQDRIVVNLPSLQISSGEIFTLVGPSGAGKSTLLRLLALLEAPWQGSLQVRLNGKLISYGDSIIVERRQLVMVFQRPALLSRSVWANVAYGLKVRGIKDIQPKLKQVLEAVSLSHLADQPVQNLSGGEMQRVALARALVLQPLVLLLDEPTANLDPYNVGLIENLIRQQHDQNGTTIILVTHNIFQAKRLADRVGLLLDGELVEVQSADGFFNAPQDPRTAAFLSGDLVY